MSANCLPPCIIRLTITRFIINIKYAFQDKTNLYIVLDLLEGGDLRHHFVKTKTLTEQQASNTL